MLVVPDYMHLYEGYLDLAMLYAGGITCLGFAGDLEHLLQKPASILDGKDGMKKHAADRFF